MKPQGGGKCHQLYKELLELSKEQASLCESADFDKEASLMYIKELLAKRQLLIDTIESIKGDYTDTADDEDLKSIIQQILAIDQRSIEYFSKQRTVVQRKIGKIQRGKQSNRAYEPYSVQSDGYFVDQKK